MTTQALDVLFPPGRIVQGNLYKAQDKDAAGAPRVVKTGPNAGKPNPVYYFAVAVPKNGSTHWAQTEWGAKLWQVGHSAFPQLVGPNGLPPTFAWKIEDGDSVTPNKRGRVPSNTEGFKGHWVVGFSSSFAPKVVSADGAQQLIDVDLVKPGFWVEVLGSVAGNGNLQNPGVYVNHKLVAFRAPDKEIRQGPDPTQVGFGRTSLPPGVSATPTGSQMTPPPAVPAGTMAPPPAVPAAPAAMAPPPAAPAPTVAVAPHAGYMVPPAAAAPPPPAAAAPPPPAAGPVWKGPPGQSYAAYKTAGWTDEQMRAQGLIA